MPILIPKPTIWSLTSFTIATLACAPVVTILWLALLPSENIWPHLVATVLPHYIINTLILMAGVGVAVLVTGVATAYLVSTYTFPLQRTLVWLLLLPLAFPAYVIAYLYTDLLEYAGPVQGALRAVFGWDLASDYWFPEIRSMGGAIMVMGVVLYPYVYLMARAAFAEQSPHLREQCRLLGRSEWQTLLFVTLPIARPAIAVGVALALMETMNDFGTVDFFAVPTLSAGLFDVWWNMNNVGGAAQIALVMLGFVVLLAAVERFGRRRARSYQTRLRAPQALVPLSGTARWLAFGVCFLPVFIGFLLPVTLLLDYSIRYFDTAWQPALRHYALNSIGVSATAAILCAGLALTISYARRLTTSRWQHLAARVAALGYALPGAVLAIGILLPLAFFDHAVDAAARHYFGFSTGLWLSGSVGALLLAYVIRFLAVALGNSEASFAQLSPSLGLAARSLGHPPWRALYRFQLPLLKRGMLAAVLLVFVDCMKELPATLLLRPFNFETLATHIYLVAADEQIEKSAVSALLLVLAGLLPVILLSRWIAHPPILTTLPTTIPTPLAIPATR